MNPMIGAALISTAGSLLSNNNGPSQPMSDLHLVDPLMQQKRAQLINQLMGGGGDTGFGANVKQGTSQLQQMMAQRGIKVGSGGAYTGAYGNMLGTALGNDANERYNRIYQMLGMPLQIASATGKNFIPGSPSEDSLVRAANRRPYGYANVNSTSKEDSGLYGHGGGGHNYGRR